MKQFLFLAGLVLISGYVSAQKIENIRAAKEGNMVAIYYDLEGKTGSDVFGVQIFCSFNNYSEPLQFISGDVGNRVSAGAGKKATWDFEKELGGYKGEVIFEVRGTLVGGYYEFQIPSAYSKFKKGGMMTINWSGGNTSEKVMIDLYKGDSKFSTITQNMDNEGKFVWTVPKQTKSSGDYKIKITNTTNYNNTGISAEFKISPKIPMVLKVAVAGAVVGAAAYFATSGGDGGTTTTTTTTTTPTTTTEENFLPEPPPPPGGN